MRKVWTLLLAGAAATALGACHRHGGGSLPKGQVVATVDGKEITTSELNAEMADLRLPAGMSRKQAETAVLQRIVNRRIVADIARDRKLDDTPAFAIQQQRADEAILTQLLQRQLVQQIRLPGREEAQAFVDGHPDMFAQHKLLEIDQIVFQAPADAAKLKELEPLTTMEQIQQKLDGDGLKYRRTNGVLDPLQLNPQLTALIQKKPDEIFVVPVNGALTANRVTGTKPDPITGDAAIQAATNILQGQRIQSLAARQIEPEVQKRRTQVVYQPGYAPPATPKAGGAPPAP